MNKLVLKAAALAATASLAAVPAIASAHGTAADSTTSAPVIHNCAGKAQTKPRTVTLYCADGNDTLIKLGWKHWGAKTPIATAENVVNDCTPNCAAGKDRRYKVKVTLSDLHSKKGISEYGKLTLSYTGKIPSGQHRTERFELTAHGPAIA